MKLEDFHAGQRVTYVPNHARDERGHPDFSHADCEYGVVTSTNHKYVFVRFRVSQENGQACDPYDLFPDFRAADK